MKRKVENEIIASYRNHPSNSPECGEFVSTCAEMNYEDAKRFSAELHFGDILINHHATKHNPIRISVFVKIEDRYIVMFDCYTEFWRTPISAGLQLERIANFQDSPFRIAQI